ncbi:MAG TPA: hypothetical protein PLB35_12255, partial [Myxococcota bacterium]|nr:hypothetical protein [Myxococcota bacterium]
FLEHPSNPGTPAYVDLHLVGCVHLNTFESNRCLNIVSALPGQQSPQPVAEQIKIILSTFADNRLTANAVCRKLVFRS